MQLLKPHVLTICKKVQICMTECVLIQYFKQPLSRTASAFLMLRGEVGCQNISAFTDARPGWVTLNKASACSCGVYVLCGLFCGFCFQHAGYDYSQQQFSCVAALSVTAIVKGIEIRDEDLFVANIFQ